jgi:hypothetical protein
MAFTLFNLYAFTQALALAIHHRQREAPPICSKNSQHLTFLKLLNII